MAMDRLLAEYFGNTVKTASANDAPVEGDVEAEKTAQMELFCKLAAQNGIDLDTLSEDQISTLWNATFDGSEKTAGEDDKDDEKEKESEGEDDKKDDAKKEHEEKKEAMAKMAEAEFLGKVMAHSLVAELREISKVAEAGDEGETQETEESKEAAMPPQLAKALGKGKDLAGKAKDHGVAAGKRVGELVSGSKAKNLKAKAETAIRSAGEAKSRGSSTQAGWQALAKKHAPAAKSEANKVKATRAGLAGVGVGAAAAGAAAASKKKESSAIDELAMVEACKIAAEAGWDLDFVSEKLAAADTLGLFEESEKIASIEDTDAAIGVRALELLETAGFPVTWES